MSSDKIQVWCDVGGTFTDCIVQMQDGTRRSIKVLSHGVLRVRVDQLLTKDSILVKAREHDADEFWTGATLTPIGPDGHRFPPVVCKQFREGQFRMGSELPPNIAIAEIDAGLEAPVLATHLLLAVPIRLPLPLLSVRLGTTRGTNALLTRRGEKVAFVTTEGFADLLEIGYQDRPDLFDLDIKKRKPLYDSVVEIRERLNADGSILVELDELGTRTKLHELRTKGYKSLAVCLIHSYCNPEHERRVEVIAREFGFEHVCLSSSIAPMIKAVSRAETCVIDAYLSPVVRDYLERVKTQFGVGADEDMLIMTSGGGLLPANQYRGKDSVLSGPAGGVVSLQAISRATQFSPLIGLDMGGTSTDVSRVDGDLELEFETVKAGVRMMIPSLKIHTVAAGGGSICWFDGVQLRVGPQSAGSDPGPACYGRGGPLTITDLNYLAGRIDGSSFPIPLHREAAQRELLNVLERINATRTATELLTETNLIDGFRKIANESMAGAVRTVSVAQGVDPRTHTLVSFGGAAGQHICEIAELLGCETILDPPAAGLLSALGMGMAQQQQTTSIPVYQHLQQLSDDWWKHTESKLRRQLEELMPHASNQQEKHTLQFRAEARYVGADGTISLNVAIGEWRPEQLSTLFHQRHRLRFGYDRPGRDVEITMVHGLSRSVALNQLPTANIPSTPVHRSTSSVIVDRNSLIPESLYSGPVLIRSDGSTTYVDKGWQAIVLSDHTLCLKRVESKTVPSSTSDDPSEIMDPVSREIFAKRFSAIAEQMGFVLEQTAISVNVKERRDFSCAVFNGSGDLIANAPHVPVHLGAMSATVKHVMQEFPSMHDGDCFITNDPYRGGSHLPDVTVITPVFVEPQGLKPAFFVACRAHHAEIGGIAPGSMAPTSRCLADEGVLILPAYLSKGGVDQSDQIEMILRTARFPTRAIKENLADIKAQQAANQFGYQALKELSSKHSVATILRYMEWIQQASQWKTERWIAGLPRDQFACEDYMDDGSKIAVSIERNRTPHGSPRLCLNFSGTSLESSGNLNANPAIVSAAVLYVIRCAISDELPLNSGVMRCIDLQIPSGILNPQRRSSPIRNAPADNVEESAYWPAVAGGNVETSQRVVDVLLGALELAAASQGTMNNLLFGDSSFGYYETIGGGAGATARSNGASAVHTHMTNTRLTDVEVLERRYPVRLVQFAVRRGSGGAGQHQGGDGMIREIMALRPLSVSLVTSRRGVHAPSGLLGGYNGQQGENWLVRLDSVEQRLESSVQLELRANESVRILTPGGGGFGLGLQ